MSETSRIVHVVDGPIALDDFAKLTEGLAAIFGDGLTIGRGRWTGYEVRTPGEQCWCRTCEDRDALTVRQLTGDPLRTISRFMVTCPDCGNKRCPRATSHDHACTGSNDVGQPGSTYV